MCDKMIFIFIQMSVFKQVLMTRLIIIMMEENEERIDLISCCLIEKKFSIFEGGLDG